MLDRTKPPHISDFEYIELPDNDSIILKNGIPLTIINEGNADVIRIDILFNGGKFEEKKILTSNVMLSMLRKGSKHHDSDEISEILDFNGSWLSNNVYDHHSCITLYSTHHGFESSIKLLEEVIKLPTFPETEFKITKERLAEEVKLAWEQTRTLASAEFADKYYGTSHPLSRRSTSKAVNQLTYNDITSFYKDVIQPNNVEIILSGKLNKNHIDLTSILFGGNWNQTTPNQPIISHSIVGESGLTIVNKSDAVQSSIIMGINAPLRSHPDYIPLRILTDVLGGYFGSRLNQKLREEKGYTYGISAGLIGRMDSSYIQIATDCDVKYTYLSIEEIKNEIAKLREELIPESELSIAKSHMLSESIKMIDSPFAIAEFMILKKCLGMPDDYFINQINIIKSITSQDLMNIAKKHLNIDNFITIIASDKNKLKKLNQ